MARSSFQKLKILYVLDYLLKNTDEDHAVTVAQLIDMLDRHGIAAERKSIYDDINALRDFGVDVLQSGSGRGSGYYVASRDFELPELKLLVDSVQSSKFITRKKSMELIGKIEALSSCYQAQQLRQQVYVTHRLKTDNEAIYYNVDEIHRGISANRKIRFHYFEYTVSKERRFRRGGAWYVISPFALTWDDENYYMVGFDSQESRVKHFRVDRMADIGTTEEPRDGEDIYQKLDMALYARKTFGMFTGQETTVRMRFDNRMASAVLDRLGQDAMLIPDGDTHFTVRTDVVVSPQFFAWLLGFEDLAQLLGPDWAVEQLREHLRKTLAGYGG